MATVRAVQATFEDLGTPLVETTFVVVDLETTGGSCAACEITEIGAVKVRGGDVVGEFQTLIRPGRPIPPFISVLTGITNDMVADAPSIETVLPQFLDFARGAVLVAHNAPFDMSFLKAACSAQDLPWPGPRVIDTVHLARQVIPRDEVPNHKLSTLSTLFGTTVTPDHRALHDARATVDVLHALLGRVGNLGVQTLEELASYSSRVSPAQRRKRYLAADLPSAPGVYVFKDDHDRPLYVGTSVDIKKRVSTYFTASEQRTRMAEMVRLATSVTPVVCATTLEAQVRELRLIAEHKPRYNRRSRHPERALWLKLTVEPFPRLSIVRRVRDDGATYAGPFGSRARAQLAMAALHEALPLRQCTKRLTTRGDSSDCALAEMGRCGAPCTGRQSMADYAEVVATAQRALTGDTRAVVRALESRMRELSERERFEDAAQVRDRMTEMLRAAARSARLRPLATSPEIVAARRGAAGGWEIVCVRYGRLAGVSLSPPGADPMPYVDALRQSAEVVAAPIAPAPAAHPEEAEKVLQWLERPGTRLVSLEGQWSCPVHGAASVIERLDPLARSRAETAGFAPAGPHARLTA